MEKNVYLTFPPSYLKIFSIEICAKTSCLSPMPRETEEAFLKTKAREIRFFSQANHKYIDPYFSVLIHY